MRTAGWTLVLTGLVGTVLGALLVPLPGPGIAVAVVGLVVLGVGVALWLAGRQGASDTADR